MLLKILRFWLSPRKFGNEFQVKHSHSEQEKFTVCNAFAQPFGKSKTCFRGEFNERLLHPRLVMASGFALAVLSDNPIDRWPFLLIPDFAHFLYQPGKIAEAFEFHRYRIELSKQIQIDKRTVHGRDQGISHGNCKPCHRRIVAGGINQDIIGIPPNPCNFLIERRAGLMTQSHIFRLRKFDL